MGTVIAIVGVLVAIWATKYRKEKHIRYYIQESVSEEKEKSYILTFWNSSKETIYRKDIYQLDLIVPKGSLVEVIYSNDQIPLNVGKEKKYKREVIYSKRRLSMDFLSPNSGYVIKVETHQKKQQKIGLLGRLKGENVWSVEYYGITYKKQINKILAFLSKPTDVMNVIAAFVCIVIFALLGVVCLGEMIQGKIDENVAQVYIYEAAFTFLATVFVVCCLNIRDIFKYYKRPKKIKEVLKEYNSDYKTIKDENNMFYYPTIDEDNKFI